MKINQINFYFTNRFLIKIIMDDHLCRHMMGTSSRHQRQSKLLQCPLCAAPTISRTIVSPWQMGCVSEAAQVCRN